MVNEKKNGFLADIPTVIDLRDPLLWEPGGVSDILELYTNGLVDKETFLNHVNYLIQHGVSVVRVQLE